MQIRAVGSRSKSPQGFIRDWSVPSLRQIPDVNDNVREGNKQL